MKTNNPSSIEPLEPRVAPASVLSYTDMDGDKVKIISSAGDLIPLLDGMFVIVEARGGERW